MSESHLDQAIELENKAEELFRKRELEEAMEAFKEAGLLYREVSDSEKACYCFAEAAKCEKIRTGFESMFFAALYSEMAAAEAVKVGKFEYARWLFREAGMLYEREGDFEKYSFCFCSSQDVYLKYLLNIFLSGKKQSRGYKAETEPVSLKNRLGALCHFCFGTMSRLLWGYGERPSRAIFSAIAVILGCSVLYYFSGNLADAGGRSVSGFGNALYFSGVTFTTLGYGDSIPLGWVRIIAVLESASGLIMAPLFLIALTRRYLRVYR